MKQFKVIEKEGETHLKPINVPYPNDDEHEEYEAMGLKHPFALQDAVLYKRICGPIPYIGSREVGTEISEADVKEVHQYKLHHQWHTCSDWAVEGLTLRYPVRTVYTDFIRA